MQSSAVSGCPFRAKIILPCVFVTLEETTKWAHEVPAAADAIASSNAPDRQAEIVYMQYRIPRGSPPPQTVPPPHHHLFGLEAFARVFPPG